MFKLYKTDMRRVLKDKLFLVVCILGVVFSAITPLLYKFIISAGGLGDEMALLPEFYSMFSAKSMFFEAFLPGSNFGLIMPVLISIVLCKDFSFGTVRNKIICGCSRTKIFLSLFFTSATVICLTMLVHALLTLGIGLIFFDYQTDPIIAADILYLITSTAMEMLVYICVAALVAFLCAAMKNVGLVIVMYVAVNFIFTIIDSILLIGVQIMQVDSPDSVLYKVMEFARKINIFSSSSIIGSGTEYTLSETLYCILPPAIFTALLIALGTMIFRKKDIK